MGTINSVIGVHGGSQNHRVTNGTVRYHLPGNWNNAFTTAGEMSGTDGAPQPDGFSVLGTMYTSTPVGASMTYGGV